MTRAEEVVVKAMFAKPGEQEVSKLMTKESTKRDAEPSCRNLQNKSSNPLRNNFMKKLTEHSPAKVTE